METLIVVDATVELAVENATFAVTVSDPGLVTTCKRRVSSGSC
ncbi:MAG: hypothetical protein ACREP9_00965 [Candidatus Dormibacteraceae bacterium]